MKINGTFKIKGGFTMEEFEKIYEIAQATGQVEFVQKMEALTENIRAQKFINVAVTGMRNGGKTTFINQIVGSEVWEPGRMDDDEKTLRVSFEPIPDDKIFQCILAENADWQKLGVILYEMREENFQTQNNFIDAVFLIISAMAPFSKNELDFLESTAALGRQVVLNGMSYLKETDREKVLAYVKKINDARSLPPVIVMDSGEDLGALARAAIPTTEALQKIRANKINAIFSYVLTELEETAKKKIDAAVADAAARVEKKAARLAEMRENFYSLRVSADSCKNRAVQEIGDRIDTQIQNTVAVVLEAIEKGGASAEIQKTAEEKFNTIAKAALDSLNESFLTDLRRINTDAKILNVPGWSADTAAALEEFAPSKNFSGFSEISITPDKSKSPKTPVMLGAGVGAIAFFSLPPIVNIIGSVAALGAGFISSLKNKKARENAALADKLTEVFRNSAQEVKTLINKIAEKSYGEINSQLNRAEENLEEPVNEPIVEDAETTRLKEILAECGQIRADFENAPITVTIETREPEIASAEVASAPKIAPAEVAPAPEITSAEVASEPKPDVLRLQWM